MPPLGCRSMRLARDSQILIAPPFFQNGAKSGFEMCFGLSTLGAGAKTRLESRIKKFMPHCICRHVRRKGRCAWNGCRDVHRPLRRIRRPEEPDQPPAMYALLVSVVAASVLRLCITRTCLAKTCSGGDGSWDRLGRFILGQTYMMKYVCL